MTGSGASWLTAHLATVAGTLLLVPFLARILRDRRPPASTLAWLLSVALVPYLGVPLYLVLGPRKRGARRRKVALYPADARSPAAPPTDQPLVARMLSADGIPSPEAGNTIELLATGEAAFARLMEALEAARTSIHISTFILGDDATGTAILELLTRKAAAGVEVRLLLDGLFALRASGRRLRALRDAGGKVVRFAPMIHLPFRGSDNLRNHRKMVLVDGESAIVGGMNLAEEYMGPSRLAGRWRDIALVVRGPAVQRIAEIALADWDFAAGQAASPATAVARASGAERTGDATIQVVPSGPDSVDDTLYEALLAACYAASRRIWVATPYFVPDDALTRALRSAARRGVDVRVIVPKRSNHLLADLAGGTYLRQIQAAGGRIATYPEMLHAKAIVVDGELGIVGSANFDMRSLCLDYEIALFLYSAPEVARLAQWFDDVVASCGDLGRAGRARSLGEDIGRLFAPLV